MNTDLRHTFVKSAVLLRPKRSICAIIYAGFSFHGPGGCAQATCQAAAGYMWQPSCTCACGVQSKPSTSFTLLLGSHHNIPYHVRKMDSSARTEGKYEEEESFLQANYKH